jgi:hypothetical protein
MKLGTVSTYQTETGGWAVEYVDEASNGRWFWNRVGVYGSKHEAAEVARRIK